jgi:hypothetical protein
MPASTGVARLLLIIPSVVVERRKIPTMTSRSKAEVRSRSRRVAWLLLIPLLALLTALLIERWRGHRALAIWKREMITKGELQEPQALWPQASAASVSFDNRLAQALTNLPKAFGNYSG